MTIEIIVLCAVGLFVSWRMELRAAIVARGLVREPSVVATRRAKMFAGIRNSTIGLGYYSLLVVAAPYISNPAVAHVMLVAACAAALLSAYLAYSLLFVTKMPCANCWSGHVVNWLLFALLGTHFWHGR